MYKGMIAEETQRLRTHFKFHGLEKCTNNLIFYFIPDDLYVDIHTDVTHVDSGILTSMNIYSATSSCSNTFKVNTRKCLLNTV
jgi:hypothetical protein